MEDEPYDSDSGSYVSTKSDASPPETLKLFFEKQIVNNALSTEELVLLRMDVVFHYAPLQRTNPNDRLPARSGLARRFQLSGRLGDYGAGLWVKHLDRMLCWSQPGGHMPRNRSFEYVAPTWSWASVSTGIYFFGKCKEKNGVMSTPYKIVGEILNVGMYLSRTGSDKCCI